MAERFNIGAVLFGTPDPSNSAGFRLTEHVGQERIRLLQLLRDGHQLPKPLVLVGQSRFGGFQVINPDQIRWETSHLRPTDGE